MLVHNQIKQPIVFEHDRQSFKFEPHGACDVPEDAFKHMRLQRFPVALTPVPPQEKAAAVVEENRQAARGDEVTQLKAALDKSTAETQAAKATLLDAEKRREELSVEIAALQKQLLEQTERAGRLEADGKAASDLLAETARKLEDSETLAKKLQSEADEARDPKKSIAPKK
jgi:hypothetical protein